jgi:tetratricopeptide (TPR) repeat protein
MTDVHDLPPVSAAPAAAQATLAGLDIAATFARALQAHQQNQPETAIHHYQTVLAADPDHLATLINLGVILKTRHNYNGAIALYSRALSLRSDATAILGNLGNALLMAGRPDEALACQERFLSHISDSPEGYFNKALCLRSLGRLDDAVFCFDRALALCPDYVEAEWDRGLTLLMAGEYYDGFAAYEARWRLPDTRRPRLQTPLWRGDSLRDKTLLLHTEQGFGDTLHFLRYAAFLRTLHPKARILLQCQPELAGLIREQNIFASVRAYDEALPRHDVQAPLLSVPWLAGLVEDQLEALVPYIKVENPICFPFFTQASAKKRIGIVWAGRPSHRNDHNRSCGLEHFLPLLALPEVRLFSLQAGPRTQDLRATGVAGAIFDLSPAMEDFADTARLIDQLDLVITVDTAVAHLAGAMGKPVWVVLPFMGDWRWGIAGDNTPWYPSMRLFRQSRLGHWQEVFSAVIQALGAWMHSGQAEGKTAGNAGD